MERPGTITVPALYAGERAEIVWQAVAGASGYLVQRAADGAAWATLAEVGENAYADTVSPDAAELRYRVAAFAGAEPLWEELDAADLRWSERDALDHSWLGALSAWTESQPQEVRSEGAPAISGEDGDLGERVRGFAVPFSVTGRSGERIDARVLLNGGVVQVLEELAQGDVYEARLSNEQVWALAEDESHELRIEASDSRGLGAARVYRFRVAEDLSRTAVYYVLRDGVPVARLREPGEWVDYRALGTHTYVVRAVDRFDNYSDSGAVRVHVAVSTPRLGDAERPEEALTLNVRRGAWPQVAQTGERPGLSATYFEGRELPVLVGGTARGTVQQLSFTHRTLAERARLAELAGRTVLYRDPFGTRLFGQIEAVDDEFLRRLDGEQDAVIDFSVRLREVAWEEAVAYD